MSSNREAEINIVPYRPSWPVAFGKEREALARTIGDVLSGPIEHVGSTAVEGLAAKPVIDIMAGIESLDAARNAIHLLPQLDYCYFPYRSDVMHWFCKPSPRVRTHHLHLVPFRSQLWIERLAFRDYLRSHVDAAREYSDLKRELANTFRFDREAYTEAKTPFVLQTVARALDAQSG